MTQFERLAERKVPLRALVLSFSALLIPIVAALVFPDTLGEAGALLWLLALIPAFLLAYYRGWRGVATTLALGMAALSVTEAVAVQLQRPVPDLLFAIVAIYIGLSVGIGVVTELLHRDRLDVEDLALTDLLTHLPNRRHARIFLENEFGAAERGRVLSLVFFDLDQFKPYNDTHGHAAGDEALQHFGEILRNSTRKMNLSARFGGEEFITILAGSDEDGAMVFAERVRTALRNANLSGGRLTVSAGVATYHSTMRTPEELIAAADLALYRAKQDGRNCVRVFGRNTGGVKGGGVEWSESEWIEPDEESPHPLAYPRTGGEIGHRPPPSGLLPQEDGPLGEGQRVLLVEDDLAVRSMIENYLTREGFSVVVASDAAEAVGALRSEFEIVITDIRLPGSSGSDLVAAVKSRWRGTQAIVITGARDAGVAAQALNAGADGFLFKPFGMPELRVHLRDALARRRRFLDDQSERRHLSAEAQDRAAEARVAILNGAKALVTAVEVRDPYTRGHSIRVGRYAAALVEALGARGDRIDLPLLRVACELHDVGKIGIPDAILNKDGELTEEELESVRRHPRIGRRILEPLFDDELILSVTTWHHERWDGYGYPDGLHGPAIPLSARIVSIADTLDAMTSDRAYRNRLQWDHAAAHILERAGSQFDPDLVEVFNRSLPVLRELRAELDGGNRSS